MRILSLITHFSHVANWETNTTRIDLVDPTWSKRSLFSKVVKLIRLFPEYDQVVFFYDVRLLVLFWILYCIRYFSKPNNKIVFTTFLCDVSPFMNFSHLCEGRIREKLRYFYYLVFARMVRTIIVHSTAEVSLYASIFRVSQNRFKFIHYFVRRDALSIENRLVDSLADKYILAAGRHRDFHTFIGAMRNTSLRGVIVAGKDEESSLLRENLPPNIEVHFEVPFKQYRAWIAGAAVFVVPLYPNQTIRSLGQIATFEAVAQQVPVVASRTFQLVDYFKDGNEILFYQPGNSQELKEHIIQLMNTEQLRSQLTQQAYQRMLKKYTDEHYCEELLKAIQECGS